MSLGLLIGLFDAMYLFTTNISGNNFYLSLLILVICGVSVGVGYTKSREFMVDQNRHFFYIFYGLHLALDQYNANKKKKKKLKKKFNELLLLVKPWVPYSAPEIFVPKIPQSLLASIKNKAFIAIEEGIDMASPTTISKEMAIKGLKGELSEDDWKKFNESLKELQPLPKEEIEERRKISSKPFQLVIIIISSVFAGVVVYQILISLDKTPADAFIPAIGVSIGLVPAILAGIHFYKK